MSRSHALPTRCSRNRRRPDHLMLAGARAPRYDAISQLQASIGNRAFASLLHAGVIQAKSLRIGPPDDPYEREADQVANQVMGMVSPATTPSRMAGTDGGVARIPQRNKP